MNLSPRAIDSLVVFRLAQQKWALPLSVVKRVVRAVEISPCPGAPPQVLGLINVQGSILPVFNFRRCLGLPARPLELADCLAIVQTSQRRVALVADEVCDVLEASAPALLSDQELPIELAAYAGVLKVSGEVVIIYDLERLLTHEEELQLTQAMPAS